MCRVLFVCFRPLWLSPSQVMVISVGSTCDEYAMKVTTDQILQSILSLQCQYTGFTGEGWVNVFLSVQLCLYSLSFVGEEKDFKFCSESKRHPVVRSQYRRNFIFCFISCQYICSSGSVFRDLLRQRLKFVLNIYKFQFI